MSEPEDDGPEDRPEKLPEQRNLSDAREERKRRRKRAVEQRDTAEFIRKALSDPAGRRVLWDILQAAGTFEERYGDVNGYAPNREATWALRGQKDLGLRLYHSWSIADRAGMLSLLDEFHPQFPKPKDK